MTVTCSECGNLVTLTHQPAATYERGDHAYTSKPHYKGVCTQCNWPTIVGDNAPALPTGYVHTGFEAGML